MMFWKEAKDKVLCLLDWWTFGSFASFQNMAIFGFMPPQLVARWEYFPTIRIGTLMYNCFWICFIFKWYGSAMYHLIMCKFISVVCTLKHFRDRYEDRRRVSVMNWTKNTLRNDSRFCLGSTVPISFSIRLGPDPLPPYPYNIRIEITVDILRRSLM